MKKGFYVNNVYDQYALCIDIDILGKYNWDVLSSNVIKHNSDVTIADLLGLQYREYEKLLLSYNAYYTNAAGLIFTYRDDAQALVDYLNEKYLLMLVLQDKI